MSLYITFPSVLIWHTKNDPMVYGPVYDMDGAILALRRCFEGMVEWGYCEDWQFETYESDKADFEAAKAGDDQALRRIMLVMEIRAVEDQKGWEYHGNHFYPLHGLQSETEE